MQRLQAVFSGSPWLRAGVLLLPLIVITAFTLQPGDQRDLMTYLVGPILLGTASGAILGWLKYSRRVFVQTAVLVSVALIVVRVWAAFQYGT